MRLKRYLPFLPALRRLRHAVRQIGVALRTSHAQLAFSQEGEDMILARTFEGQGRGFYVDVGAHHPVRFSNTYAFYRRGWTGINVDAMPGSMDPFRKVRPRDQNIEAAVGHPTGVPRTFYLFSDPALNTFDETLAKSLEGTPYRLLAKKEIATLSLKEILDRHLPAGQAIDFLSVDVEGIDVEVLQSNDWEAYRPRYVLAECLHLPWDQLPAGAVYQFLVARNYRPFAKTVNTIIFQDRLTESAR